MSPSTTTFSANPQTPEGIEASLESTAQSWLARPGFEGRQTAVGFIWNRTPSL